MMEVDAVIGVCTWVIPTCACIDVDVYFLASDDIHELQDGVSCSASNIQLSSTKVATFRRRLAWTTANSSGIQLAANFRRENQLALY